MTTPLPVGANGQPVQVDRGAWSTVAIVPDPVLDGNEHDLATALSAQVMNERFTLELRDAYYRGEVRVQDLGISIPQQLRGLRQALGWPRVCVDSLDERLDVEGFRYPGSTDVDSALQDIWTANDMQSESQLANLDALIFGRGLAAVGLDDGGAPLITVESPMDMAVSWDARTRRMRAAFRLYDDLTTKRGTLYTPNATVHVSDHNGMWVVDDRDDHNLGFVPVVRIANRPRSYSRIGASEISAEIMAITDAACRTLLGLEVAREFYSAPQRYILGATEESFQDAEGNKKSAWETYLGRVLALERDENGEVPQVGQFTPYDPSTFTKVVDMYAKIISSITGLPPHVLGYTTDNPASADAIRSSEMRLKLKADRKTRMFGTAWRDVMKIALTMTGDAPPDLEQLVTVWADTATPTPAATTDAVTKQIAAGVMPSSSEVALERLGYNAVERQRIAADRAADAGEQFLAELARSTVAKEARVDTSLASDLQPPADGAGG